MAATRVTPAEVLEMQRLYREYGTFAAVARKMHRSADTVARYIRMKGVPQNIRLAVDALAQKQA